MKRFLYLLAICSLTIVNAKAIDLINIGNQTRAEKNQTILPPNFPIKARKPLFTKPVNATSTANVSLTSQKLSLIEREFNSRYKNLKNPLKQFGYRFFKGQASISPSMPVDESYVLGPGDELFMYVIGNPPNMNLSKISRLIVDRQGKVYIPGFGVFYVWGMTLKDAQNLISRSLGVNAKLTVGKLRTFPVYVSGNVNRPGAIIVTRANTIIDALMMADGIDKTGTLRNVIVTRKTRRGLKRIHIDFYKLLLKGEPVDMRLRDGDVIFVGPIGRVAGITGVKQPGIYELSTNETLRELISMAGGLLPSSYACKIVILRYMNNQFLKVTEGSLKDGSFMNQGVCNFDLVKLKPITKSPENAITIEGQINYPGTYSYRNGMKLSDILTHDMLTKNTNVYYAEIDRRNPKTLEITKIIRFSPIDVLSGKGDIPLQKLDVIRFYPKYVNSPIEVSGLVQKPIYVPYQSGMKLSDALSSVKFTKSVKELKAVVFKRKTKSMPFCKQWRNNTEGNYSCIESKSRPLYKQWRNSTEGNCTESVPLYKLLTEADKTFNIKLNSGDRIVIESLKPNEIVEKVSVLGYVGHPGVFKIGDKTTLYDVLKEAGGFKENAYPRGIVILRRSIAEMQKKRLVQAINLMRQELEKEEAGIMQSELTSNELRAKHAAFESKKKLLSEMEKSEVTGRISGITVPFNIEKLKNSPYNIFLEDGDKIYIPKVPSSVLVFGEVYNPNAMVYVKGETVRDYLAMVGGLTRDADEENIFVIRADGSVVSSSNLNRGKNWDGRNLPEWGEPEEYSDNVLDYRPKPGDAIIVPTKVHVPIMWRPLVKDIMQIIYQGAITVYTITKL